MPLTRTSPTMLTCLGRATTRCGSDSQAPSRGERDPPEHGACRSLHRPGKLGDKAQSHLISSFAAHRSQASGVRCAAKAKNRDAGAAKPIRAVSRDGWREAKGTLWSAGVALLLVVGERAQHARGIADVR
jgi:hypothetical protein